MAGLAGEEKAVVGIVLALALAAGALLWWRGQAVPAGVAWEEPADAAETTGAGPAVSDPGSDAGGPATGEPGGGETIVIHVAGAVVRAGVYQLPAGSRVVDALEAAGGASASADPNAVNLARLLADGERLYIPTREEVHEAAEGNSNGGSVGWVDPGAGANGGGSGGGTYPAGTGSTAKVNLNTATATELDSLPGIGPTLAARIVDYRSRNGPFASPEELMNVSGIGSKKYADLAQYVTVR